MNRNIVLLGAATVFGVAAVVAGVSHSSRGAAPNATAEAASVSSCCAKGEASAATAETCTRGAATTASVNGGCTREASAHTASAAMGCDKSAAAAAAGTCTKSAATAAGGDACCKTGAVKTAAAGEGCKAVCDEAKTASAFKDAVDDIPYRENKRLVLSGAYVCGHCNLKVTEGCSPMFKTADGKIYPLIKNPEAMKLRAADSGNGVEIATSVKKLDGIKYLEVKSYKSL